MASYEERDQHVLTLYKGGLSMGEVGVIHNLSRQRVQQILRRIDPEVTAIRKKERRFRILTEVILELYVSGGARNATQASRLLAERGMMLTSQSINRRLHQAGYKKFIRIPITITERKLGVIKAVHQFMKKTGHFPMSEEFRNTNNLPSYTTVQRYFRSLGNLRTAIARYSVLMNALREGAKAVPGLMNRKDS